jgi:hypothetical protein
MEPRPQFPRQPVGPRPQPQGQAPASGPSPQQPVPPVGAEHSGYPDGIDPTAFIAPPRTEYDYSPLDLAPPGQRRRRQLIAGAIGALSVVLLGALLVFGWILLRGGDDNNGPNDQVAVVTESSDPAQGTASQAADTGSTPPATEPPASTDPAAAQPTEAAVAPTEAPAPGVPQNADELRALLPDNSVLPAGFDAGTDSERDLAGVVEALGGSRTAEQSLQGWGWTGNVERVFNADPNVVEPGTATSVSVSLHGFKDAPSAAAALPFYSDILVNIGYADVEPPALGENARMLTQPQEDGGVNVALYVQSGGVLYRIGGYAPPGSDPTQTVINVATAMLGG